MIVRGSKVKWKWGNRTATGIVSRTYKASVSEVINNSTITRNGSVNNKAILITQQDGSQVFKLESEVQPSDE